MKIYGATYQKVLVSGNFIFSVGSRYETVYFNAKFTTQMKEACGATGHMMDKLISVRSSSG